MRKSASKMIGVLAWAGMSFLLLLNSAVVSASAAQGDDVRNKNASVATFEAAKAASAQVARTTGDADEVVAVGCGYLDPEDPGKGAAVVVYTRKNLTRERANALNSPVKVTVEGRQVEVPIRIEESGEFFAHPSKEQEGAEAKNALAQKAKGDDDVATLAAAKAASVEYALATSDADEVVAVGYGYLDPEDPGKGAAVVVYTRKNLTRERANALNSPVKVTVGGRQAEIPIRIEESGEFFARLQAQQPQSSQNQKADDQATATPDPEYIKRKRPLPAGYSVGTTSGSGTAGLIVIKDNTLYILSNNHVLNLNNSNGFSATLQPGAADGGVDPSGRIGRLFQFVKLKASGNNQDSAISLPTKQSDLDPRYGRGRITVPGHYVRFSVGAKAIKAGRTTGDINDGYVDSITTQTRGINYGTYGGLGTATFNAGLVVFKSRSNAPVSLPGDSGSVWLNKDDKYALAVNFAGPADGKYSLAFPINWAMTTYGVKVALPARAAGDAEQIAGEAPAKAGDTKTMRAEDAALTRESPTTDADVAETAAEEP